MTTSEIINENITSLFIRSKIRACLDVGYLGRCHYQINVVDFDGSTKTQIFRLPGREYSFPPKPGEDVVSEIIKILESRIKSEEERADKEATAKEAHHAWLVEQSNKPQNEEQK